MGVDSDRVCDPTNARIMIYREFKGENYAIPVEVWDTGDGVCARTTECVRCHHDNMIMMAETEDPELSESEMIFAKTAISSAV
jgi:hypothetical protein